MRMKSQERYHDELNSNSSTSEESPALDTWDYFFPTTFIQFDIVLLFGGSARGRTRKRPNSCGHQASARFRTSRTAQGQPANVDNWTHQTEIIMKYSCDRTRIFRIDSSRHLRNLDLTLLSFYRMINLPKLKYMLFVTRLRMIRSSHQRVHLSLAFILLSFGQLNASANSGLFWSVPSARNWPGLNTVRDWLRREGIPMRIGQNLHQLGFPARFCAPRTGKRDKE